MEVKILPIIYRYLSGLLWKSLRLTPPPMPYMDKMARSRLFWRLRHINKAIEANVKATVIWGMEEIEPFLESLISGPPLKSSDSEN